MITDSTLAIDALSAAPNGARPWSPIVTSDVGAVALAAVSDIARAIPSYITRQEDGSRDVTFGAGAAGVAVFLHYAASALDDAEAHTSCIDLMSEALDNLQAVPRFGLFAGYSGIAWTVSHLQQRGVDELSDIDLAEIDDVLTTLLRRVPWPDDYDLISGLVGIGVYGLERMRQGRGEAIVAGVVARLAEMVELMGDGLATWFHPPWHLPPFQRETFPEGWYNLGVAHGVPGVLGFLARAVRHDVRRSTAARLLAAGARWTSAQATLDARGHVRMGCQLDPRVERRSPSPFRDAWCYGAPGAAIALLASATVLDDDVLAEHALTLARTAAAHDWVQAGAHDASLCHGASGLALLYARLHAATGEPAFADAARLWADHTLALRTPSGGVAGFSYLIMQDNKRTWIAGSNFLEGAAGIGLSLLALSTSEPPSWDRVLLADPMMPSRIDAR